MAFIALTTTIFGVMEKSEKVLVNIDHIESIRDKGDSICVNTVSGKCDWYIDSFDDVVRALAQLQYITGEVDAR